MSLVFLVVLSSGTMSSQAHADELDKARTWAANARVYWDAHAPQAAGSCPSISLRWVSDREVEVQFAGRIPHVLAWAEPASCEIALNRDRWAAIAAYYRKQIPFTQELVNFEQCRAVYHEVGHLYGLYLDGTHHLDAANIMSEDAGLVHFAPCEPRAVKRKVRERKKPAVRFGTTGSRARQG